MFQTVTLEQKHQFINTVQPWEAWDEARRARLSTQGLMRWHKVSGKEYLKRRVGRSEKPLGARPPATEAMYDTFQRNKTGADERYEALTKVLSEQSRMAVGARLARLPRVIAGPCRMLVDNSRWRIVGTNAMFAYEARAGVQIGRAMMATEDADVLWDSRGGDGFLHLRQI